MDPSKRRKMLYLFGKTFKQKADIFWTTRNGDSEEIIDEVVLTRQRFLTGGDHFHWDCIPRFPDRMIDLQFESEMTSIKFVDGQQPVIDGPYVKLINQSEIPKEFRIDPNNVRNAWIFLISDQ